MEKQLSYKNLLEQSEQDKDQLVKQYQLEDAQAQLEADIKATERSITQAERELPKVILMTPFNTTRIVDKKWEIESLKKGLQALVDLKDELFPKS